MDALSGDLDSCAVPLLFRPGYGLQLMARRVHTIGEVGTHSHTLVQSGTLITRTYDASFDGAENLEIIVDSCEVNFVRNPDPTYVTHSTLA